MTFDPQTFHDDIQLYKTVQELSYTNKQILETIRYPMRGGNQRHPESQQLKHEIYTDT